MNPRQKFQLITLDTKLKDMITFFDKHHLAMINDGASTGDDDKIVGVITKFDLLQYHM